jgi:hypothetical protein
MSSESPRLSNSVLSTRYSALSAYDPIRLHQRPLRNCQADLLRRVQIDHELEFHRLLNWEIGDLGAIEDLVHIDNCSF